MQHPDNKIMRRWKYQRGGKNT